MGKAKRSNLDDRKEFIIRYKIDGKGRVSFIDPCCDDIPVALFMKIIEALSNVQNEWNEL